MAKVANESPSPSPTTTNAPPAFAKNDFSAILTMISFREDAVNSSTEKAELKSSASRKRQHEELRSEDGGESIRLSLLAHLVKPSADATTTIKTSQQLSTVTIASHIFAAKNIRHAEKKKSSNSSSSSTTTATSEEEPASGMEGPSLGGVVVLRSPLLLSSAGPIKSLAVVADVLVPVRRKSSHVSRAYTGSRRFLVQLNGVQQTTLTEEQVLLLSQ